MARTPSLFVIAAIVFAVSIIVGSYRAGRATAWNELAAIHLDEASRQPRHTECPPCKSSGSSWLDFRRPLGGKNEQPLQRRRFIQAGGVAHDGLGSTLKFLKESISIAHVLGMDVGFTQSNLNRDYKVTSLLKADTLNDQRLCDLHTIMIEDPAYGPYDLRVERATAELDAFRQQVKQHCHNGVRAPLELLPHVRDRLQQCDIVVWADQRVRIDDGWNECTQSWLRQVTGSKATKKKTVGLHYRWGDIHWTKEAKWRYDDNKVEKILHAIKTCDPSWDVSVYMEASDKDESFEDRAKHLAPIKSFDRIVDTGDPIDDLGSLASHEILILNSGSYSEAAAGASYAKAVLWNGNLNPHGWLRRTSTELLTVDEAAELDWCQKLREMG